MGDVDWGRAALLLAVLMPSVILHEVAHGWVADRFGDDTARRAGRLTLNPVAHVELFGTILLPLMTALSGLGAFGWAKPVPVTPRKLRDPIQHSLYVGLAGPATNIALALLAALGYRLVEQEWLLWLGFVNVLLAVFNLLPIPPLDGSALVERVLPNRWWPVWLRFRQWGMLLVLLLVFYGPFEQILRPPLRWWERLL